MTDELLTTSATPLDLPEPLDPTGLRRRIPAAIIVGLLTAGAAVAALLPSDADGRALVAAGLAAFCTNVLGTLGLTEYIRGNATPVSTAALNEADARIAGERAGMEMGYSTAIADLHMLAEDG